MEGCKDLALCIIKAHKFLLLHLVYSQYALGSKHLTIQHLESILHIIRTTTFPKCPCTSKVRIPENNELDQYNDQTTALHTHSLHL